MPAFFSTSTRATDRRRVANVGVLVALLSGSFGVACKKSKPAPLVEASLDAAPVAEAATIKELDASADELRELDREIALDRDEPPPTPEAEASRLTDVEVDKGPDQILAWRRDPAPKAADRAWAKVWLVGEDGRITNLPPRAAFSSVRAIERHLMLCAEDSRASPALATQSSWFKTLGNWPTSSTTAPTKRIEVFVRNLPITTTTAGGSLEAWSLLIPVDETGAGAVVSSSGDTKTLVDQCPPCELVDSPMSKFLPARQQRACAKTIKARRAQPEAIEPEHSQKSWVAYLASADLPTDKALSDAARAVAKLGYNALSANAGCDTSNLESKHMYMSALYFESKKDATAFAKLHKPLFVGPVQTYCLD